MSEPIASKNDSLFEYLEGLYHGIRDIEWFEKYKNELETATPWSVNTAIDRLIGKYDDYEKIEKAVSRFIRAATGGLEKFKLEPIPEDHFLTLLNKENEALKEIRKEQSQRFKSLSALEDEREIPSGLLERIDEDLKILSDLKSHYGKIQNILFPAFEDSAEDFRCVKLMWHIQDEILLRLKQLREYTSTRKKWNRGQFNKLYGEMYIKSGALIFREEAIFFPILFRAIPENKFKEMFDHMDEFGMSFGISFTLNKEATVSETINNSENSKKELQEILTNLKEDKDIRKMKKRFSAVLKNLSPEEIAEAEQALISEGIPVEEVQKLCEVHVAAFEDTLNRSARKEKVGKSPAGHPIDTYKKENKELRRLLGKLKRSIANPEATGSVLEEISQVEKHYARKENQLFPFLENVDFTGPSKVMWGKHDEIREQLKIVRDLTSTQHKKELKKEGKSLIAAMKRMIFMEEKILFPTALRKLPEEAWIRIRKGEAEIGYAWIKPGNLWDPDILKSPAAFSVPEPKANTSEIDLSVGKLNPGQIDLMLKNLPFDITFVDENDRVRYYSQGKERIFPRSPGIIGRDVGNCHPPKSVHVVQKIVEDFKNRKRSEAKFWIQMNGQFIYISYFPLFEGENYKGVIEVSQNIAPLRELEGEKRLLD